MCVTCGCSDGQGVRITDPATGESTTLDGIAHAHLHQHTDAAGRRFVHTHPLTIEPAPTAPAQTPSEERHHG